MPTVIDSLVVELGLDPRNFTDGQKAAIKSLKDFEQESDRAKKNTKSQSEALLNFFQNAKRQAIGFTAALFGARGVADYITQVTQMNAELGRSARILNVSTKVLSTWDGMVKQTGGSIEDMRGSQLGLNDQINSFLTSGQPGNLGVLNNFGVQLQDLTGKAEDIDKIFRQINKGAQGMSVGYARSILQKAGFGSDTINVLTMTADAFERLYKEQQRLGNVSDEQAKHSQKLQSEWAATEKAATSFGNSLQDEVAPGLSYFLSLIKEVFVYLRGVRERVSLVTVAITALGGTLTGGLLQGFKLFSRFKSWLEGGAPSKLSPVSGGAGVDVSGGSPALAGGHPVKPGAGQFTPTTARIKEVLDGMSGIDRYTSAKDKFHSGFDSAHNEGRALDLTVKGGKAKAAEMAEEIRKRLAQFGIPAIVGDEYNFPKKNTSAGHLHISAAALAGAGGTAGGRTVNINGTTINVYDAKDAPQVAREVLPQLKQGIVGASANSGGN